MSEAMVQAAWIREVLGMPIPLDELGGGRAGPPSGDVPAPKGSGALGHRAKGDGTLAELPIVVADPPRSFGTKERRLQVQKSGKQVVFTAPNPPVGEIVISGGGGKGVALVGMLKALETAKITEGLKKVSGSSVGAMTAAMIAAGMTAEELQATADDKETVKMLTDETGGGVFALLGQAISNRGSPLTGEGLKKVVGDSLGATLEKRIGEFEHAKPPPSADKIKAVEAVLARIKNSPEGPTFKQMSELAALIPTIKELSVTGTYKTELDVGGTAERNTQGKLMVFDANNTPNVPVALAVQASAAFPFAFKPVDIDLAAYEEETTKEAQAADKVQGVKPAYKVRFIDGGVMNNTPTASSIGNEMPLNRVPDSRGMTFVFQGSDSAKATADAQHGGKPSYKAEAPGKMGRWVDSSMLKSSNAAAEYALSRDAQKHAEEFVVVPLKFDFKPSGSKLNPANWFGTDMSGTLGGTLNFSPNKERVAEIRRRTEAATAEQIAKTKDEPKSYRFESDAQMLMSVPLRDLATLMNSDYEGAREAYEFRVDVDATIEHLAKSGGNLAAAAEGILSDLSQRAGTDKERTFYMARAIHKGGLEGVINAVLEGKVPVDGELAKAVGGISEAKKAFAIAHRLLTGWIDPKMQLEDRDGASWNLLRRVEGLLLGALSLGDIADALRLLVDHYKDKSDRVATSTLAAAAAQVARVVGTLVPDKIAHIDPHAHGHAEFYRAMKHEWDEVEKSLEAKEKGKR